MNAATGNIVQLRNNGLAKPRETGGHGPVAAREPPLPIDQLAPFGSLLEHRLQQALAAPLHPPTVFAVLVLSIESCADVDPVHGPQAMDRVLRIAAARLARAVRRDDAFGRIGEGEFGCVLTGMRGSKDLRRLAHRLQDVAAEPIHLERTLAGAQVSLGVARFPADGVTAEDLISNARAAMHRVLRHRTGFAFFDDSVEA